MRRRDFITLVGGAAAAWPLAAHAQQIASLVVGYLHSSSPETNVNYLAAFRKGLSEAGFVEGQNVAIEFRWAAGRVDRLPEMAADLVRRRVAVIATLANTPATLAAKAATATIPIVFSIGADPITLGLVSRLNLPGGHATGVSFQTAEIVSKRLGLQRELVPQTSRFVALVNPTGALFTDAAGPQARSARTAGSSIHAYPIKPAGTYRCAEKECRKNLTVIMNSPMERMNFPMERIQ